MATVNGTANNDVLFIDKGKSNDTLLGLAGNDYLDALPGAGSNILRGGDGNDELYAYQNDQLYGDAGDDKLYSDGNGNNTLSGGDGNDIIYADRNDIVTGDAGDDTIYAGKGGNTIAGGAGKDVFVVANVDVPKAPNTITDFDRINDTIRINLAGVKTLSDLAIAQSGTDATISFGSQQLAILKNTATASLNSTDVVVTAGAPNNAGTVTNRVIATTEPANLNLSRKDFNTKVTGDSRDNIIDASTGGGDNQLFAGDGNDELYAYQNDKLFGEGGNDILDASQGKGGNTLDGGIGDDRLLAGTSDILIGGDGDDTLFAGLGGNTLTGGNGKDTFVLAAATLPTKANIITDFKAGTDTLKIVGLPGIGDDITKLTATRQGSDTLLKVGTTELALLKGIQANAIDGVINPITTVTKTISATDSADLIFGSKDSKVKIVGDSRNNIIDASTGSGTNEIFAGDGDDELYAYQNDRLYGEGGNDILDASQGKGGNTLDGGIGNDRLFAGTNDTLIGGDGDDTLFAGLGGNTLTGGNGKDTFFLAAASLPTKANIITDYKIGTDTLKIVGLPGGIGDDLTKLTTMLLGSDTLLKAGNVELALLKGIQANSIADLLTTPTPTPTPPTPIPNPNPTPIAGITVGNNLFVSDTTVKGLSINAVSQKAGVKVNEIGFFAVDDTTGKIGGVTPGAAGYLKLVLDSAKPIFSTLDGSFFSTSQREVALDPTKTYEFFEVQDGSIADLQQQIASGKTPTNMLFALPDASASSPFKVTTNSANDGYKISINNDELVLNVSKLAGSTPNVPIGAKSQGLTQGRVIDLTDYAGKTLKADITTTSVAGYNNTIGFYAVEDAIGTIKTAAGTFKPGDANYALEAIKSAVLSAGKTDKKSNQDIVGGKIYAPVVVAQGTLTDFVSANVNNNSTDPNAIHAYFNYLGANPDKLDHFRLLGNNTFGVEDLYGGGDRDFNDVVVNINIKTV